MAIIQENIHRKTRNYYDAPRSIQKLFDIGVPERYWYVHTKELSFAHIRYEDEYDDHTYSISPKNQIVVAKKILKQKDPVGVIAIGSQPTADMSLAFMFYMVKRLNEKGFPVYVHNMASGTKYFSEHITDRTIIFLYNVNSDDEHRRIQDVRDIIFKTQGHLRIIAFAGDNPLRFMCEKVRYYPNSYFYLLGKYRRVRIKEV